MIKGYCKYFEGCDNGCQKNHNIREMVGGEDFGWIKRMPCTMKYNSEVKCNDYVDPTEAEIKESEEKAKRGMLNVMEACAMILEKHGAVEPDFEPILDDKKKGVAGTIDCPVCGGKLSYKVQPGNHHIWGHCETENCLSWMQ
jgi:hypothetical protein